jgi:hypothetical protein
MQKIMHCTIVMHVHNIISFIALRRPSIISDIHNPVKTDILYTTEIISKYMQVNLTSPDLDASELGGARISDIRTLILCTLSVPPGISLFEYRVFCSGLHVWLGIILLQQQLISESSC